ncbi:MAG: response regulator [candidate division KSB1 bacterium]|nr:response regulator [candidate division KSB1 bacterium]
MSAKKLNILLVEDNSDHVELVKRALKSEDSEVQVYAVPDGQEALDFVFKKGKYKLKQELPTPDMILLDIKLPKIDGYTVVKTIKSDSRCKDIPIIVLTTSARPEDIERMYTCGANSYIIKPSQYQEFVKIMGKVEAYWSHFSN